MTTSTREQALVHKQQDLCSCFIYVLTFIALIEFKNEILKNWSLFQKSHLLRGVLAGNGCSELKLKVSD